ncbi:MAG TPA: Flp pilus assembly protein CpaB [Steroidobacteraceae bacterium]
MLIATSLLLAGSAAWMANRWLAARAAPAPVVNVHILASAMNLPVGTKIDSKQVKVMEVLPGEEPAGAFHDLKEIEGKVTVANVSAGQLLLAPMFIKEGDSALAAVVGRDKRAVTVRVDDVVGVAGFLMPGNRVDVVATHKDDKTGAMTSETILSDIKVLAVDQTTAVNSNEPVVVHAVTLEVTPSDGETLLMGKAEGSIQLALRNPLDKGDARHKPPPPKIVAKAPVVVRDPAIMVIRGTLVGRDSQNNNSAQNNKQ